MALPTGTISMSQVNVELGKNATATISLNDADVRALAERLTGTISMDDLRGKSSLFKFNITSNITNANLRTLAINAGWNQNAAVEATINFGVTISGNTQANSTAAMTINGTWPNGVTLINNGIIQGRGGNGGNGGSSTPNVTAGLAGSAGGRSLLASVAVNIENNGSIRGGGGGGGGGGAARLIQFGRVPRSSCGGGGGGGGISSNVNASGGAGGVASGSSTNVPGSDGGTGTISSAGSGGAGGFDSGSFGIPPTTAGSGGNGGNHGASGAAGQNAQGGGGAGGAAGQAVSGNSNITWLATGTRTGPIV